jgi:hypothetical protein
MGFVEDSIRKVWVGTNVSAIVGASTSVHKLVHVQVTSVSQVELFRRRHSTCQHGDRARRGAVASEDGKRKLVALYTAHGHGAHRTQIETIQTANV